MSVFQSNGDEGRGFTQKIVLVCISSEESESPDSCVTIVFHSVSLIFFSHALTEAILSVGAVKKFGYVKVARPHLGVRNSTDRTISIAREGVAPFSSAAASSLGVGETCFKREGIV